MRQSIKTNDPSKSALENVEPSERAKVEDIQKWLSILDRTTFVIDTIDSSLLRTNNLEQQGDLYSRHEEACKEYMQASQELYKSGSIDYDKRDGRHILIVREQDEEEWW